MEQAFELKSILISSTTLKIPQRQELLRPRLLSLFGKTTGSGRMRTPRPKTKRTPYKAQSLSFITSLLFLNIPKRFLPWSEDMAPLSDIKGGEDYLTLNYLELTNHPSLLRTKSYGRLQSAAKIEWLLVTTKRLNMKISLP